MDCAERAPAIPVLTLNDDDWRTCLRGIGCYMCIVTAREIPPGAICVDPNMHASLAIFEVTRPMPGLHARYCFRERHYVFTVTNESFQITIRTPALLAQALEIIRVIFYGGTLPRASMSFTNLNLALEVTPYFAIDIGRLRAAVAAGRCPGMYRQRCSRPRSAASVSLYLTCPQENDRGKQSSVNITVGTRRVTIIGVCNMSAVAFAGAVRRLLVGSGAFDGPHGIVDHREALWPLIGAQDTHEITRVMAYMASHPVALEKPPRARGQNSRRPMVAGKSSRSRAPRKGCRSG